jgi:hypothetical protein
MFIASLINNVTQRRKQARDRLHADYSPTNSQGLLALLVVYQDNTVLGKETKLHLPDHAWIDSLQL